MDQIDTSKIKTMRHEPSPQGALPHRHAPRPEEISLQGIPAMGAVLREIGVCIAIALGLALLAAIYAHVKG